MNRIKIKSLLAYSTIIAIVAGGGYMKVCRDNSKNFSVNTNGYVADFVDDEFKIAAHRGYTHNAIENTMVAFDDAKDAKFVDYIELDARLSADGKLVVVHNSSVKNDDALITIEETESENILENDFKYIPSIPNTAKDLFSSLFSKKEGVMVQEKLIKSFGKDFSIPALAEAIDACGDKTILLDLKFNGNQVNFYEAIKDFLDEQNNTNIILQSANLDALRALQTLLPEYKYLAIVDSVDDFQKCETFDMLGVRKNLIRCPDVKNALDDGKGLSIWTINSTKQLDAVTKEFGDDATNIIYVTDYPDVVASHLNDLSKQKKLLSN